MWLDVTPRCQMGIYWRSPSSITKEFALSFVNFIPYSRVRVSRGGLRVDGIAEIGLYEGFDVVGLNVLASELLASRRMA